MAEIWDVAAHVESNPEDHPQRWRLAKKLYAAHEYRLALEHLNVLKNEWTPKLNVRRYLGATYYRLGRYSEAIAELEDSIREWPDEIGMREQLAYVLKSDKQYEPALRAWKEVQRLQPDHAIARKSIQRLEHLIKHGEESQEAETKYDPVLTGSEDIPTPPPMPGMECARCGAQNSEEFGDCWRCGNPLPHARSITQPILFDMNDKSFFIESKLLGRLGAMAALVLLLCALFLGMLLLSKYKTGLPSITSLAQIYDHALVPSRIAAGLAMLLLWPVVLRLTIRMLRIKPRPKAVHAYVGGILLGALALAIMLMPMPALLLVPGNAILLFMALVVSVVALEFRMGAALALWATHFAVMFLLGFTAFWATEMYQYGNAVNPVTEISALWNFSKTPGNHANMSPMRLPSVLSPINDNVQWHSSGSDWLDAKISDIVVNVRVEEPDADLRFQIYEEGKLKFHEELNRVQNHQFPYRVSPEKQYTFRVIGSENISVQVLLQSLLPVEILKK
jgi:tetratricopeptide (TPR) repeat protein